MARSSNTNVNGQKFDEKIIEEVWEKATPETGYSSFSKDKCGASMQRSKHGDTSDKHGWEIDHIKPVSKGGTDDIENLQPLQWENNRHKGDKHPDWECKIRV